jgi:hypothetical protein
LLGLHDAAPFPGTSWAVRWGGEQERPAPPGPVFSEVSRGYDVPRQAPTRRGDMQSLVADGLHYIRNGDGVEELYDYAQDPFEQRDLAALQPAALEPFRRALAAIRAATPAGR